MTIAGNLSSIREKIERAAERTGRSADDIILVAVSKTVPIAAIQSAISAGITHLGENRVQEAYEKFALPGDVAEGKIGRDGITLHMIGTLQRNKANRAAALFDYVQSVDRAELAWSLEKAAAVERGGQPLPVLLEVNLTGEASKSGISPQDLPKLADVVSGCSHLSGMGLMTIARQDAGEKELRATFSTLRNFLDTLRAHYPSPNNWQHLSMGMSGDYELAIQEGATIIRLGRAIFGERSSVTKT
ncbi:MAG: YggS family pyridoxal phosphate-dependent enzyme [Chloroflexota bacterium]